MTETATHKFAWEHCGKQFAWKPELAGRKAKCKACGDVLTVPKTIVSAAPPPPRPLPSPPKPAGDEGEYDFADGPAPAIPVTVVAMPIAGPTLTNPGYAAIGYRGQMTPEEKRKVDRFSFAAMVYPPRDIYAPAAVLAIGFFAIIGWAMSKTDAGALAIVVVSVAVAVATLVKTVVMTLGAIVIAPRFGISFGDLRTAILKIAAIIVFTDACSIWLFGGTLIIRGIFYDVLLTGLVISALCYILFDMDNDDTAMFALPMALISRVIGIVLTVVVAGLVAGARGAGAGGPVGPGAPSATASGPAGSSSVAPAAGSNGLAGGSAADPLAGPGPTSAPPRQRTEKDRAVARIIEIPYFVAEARDYRVRGKRTKVPAAEAFYAASAPNIYLDIRGRQNTTFGHMYVQLPDEPGARTACFAVAANRANLDGMTIDASLLKDAGQQFLVFDVPPR